MLVVCDELAGLFINMSRFSARPFWLEAWCGGPFVVERVSRPPVAVKHLPVGINGGFQPDKLARAFSGDKDGMSARILFAWPPEPEYQPLAEEGAEIEAGFQEALMRLIALDADEGNDPEPGDLIPRELALSSGAKGAKEVFEEFRQRLYASKAALDGREREWFSKGPGNVLRLTGMLASLVWAMPAEPAAGAAKDSNPSDPFEKILQQAHEPTEIDAEIMGNAVRPSCDYLGHRDPKHTAITPAFPGSGLKGWGSRPGELRGLIGPVPGLAPARTRTESMPRMRNARRCPRRCRPSPGLMKTGVLFALPIGPISLASITWPSYSTN